MTRREATAGMDRAARRSAERDHAVKTAALAHAGGHPLRAATALRIEAEESIQAALTALQEGAGVERVRQVIERADRRLRLSSALAVETGEAAAAANPAAKRPISVRSTRGQR